MNETLELILKRFSCRAFTDEPVSNEALALIAKAAAAAPTAMNRQENYRVIIVKDKTLLAQMDQTGMTALKALPDQGVYQRFMERGGTLFYNAPAMFVLPITKGCETDLGIIAQNIVLAAESLGLATCHCGMARLLFEGEYKSKYESLLNFPDDYFFGLSVLVGHAARAGAPHNPDMSKISTIG